MRRPASIPWLVAVVAALASAATSARAHDFYLQPDPAVVAPGTPFTVAMHAAEHFPGAAIPWRSDTVTEFFITDSHGRTDIEEPILAGDPQAARLTLRGPGTAVIALSTGAAYIEVPAADFETYIKEEGLDAAQRARVKAGRVAAPGRVRFTRHVKTLVNLGGPGSSVALTRTGLALEIVPEDDPAHLRPGGRLPVRVFYRGNPDVDDRVCVAAEVRDDAAGPSTWCGPVDGAGRVTVPIAIAGWQMIRATRMIPIHDDPKADFHSYWAALTMLVETPPVEPPGTLENPSR